MALCRAILCVYGPRSSLRQSETVPLDPGTPRAASAEPGAFLRPDHAPRDVAGQDRKNVCLIFSLRIT